MLEPNEQTLIVTFLAFKDWEKENATPTPPYTLSLLYNPIRLIRFLIKTKGMTDPIYKSRYFHGWCKIRITQLDNHDGTVRLEYLDEAQLHRLILYIDKRLARLNPPEYEQTQLTIPVQDIFPTGEVG